MDIFPFLLMYTLKKNYLHIGVNLRMLCICLFTGLIPASSDVIHPFILGCQTKNPKLVHTCLVSLQKLISYEAVSTVSIHTTFVVECVFSPMVQSSDISIRESLGCFSSKYF